MEQNALQRKIKSTGVEIAKVTGQSMYEFGRALVTLLVGGLFLFYSYMTGVGFIQTFQAGQFLDAVILAGMFLLATGAAIFYVAVINGIVSEQ